MKQNSKYVLKCFLELKELWEELNSYRQLHVCICYHRCRCHNTRNAQEYKLEDQSIQFLTDLNDRVLVVKTQVLLMDPLPLINRIYSLVVQEKSNHKTK